MKRLFTPVALFVLCSTSYAEDFVYTTTFDSHLTAATLPGWDTSIGSLEAIEFSITGRAYGIYQTPFPVTDGNFFLFDQIFLNNNIQMGVSNTNTPFSFTSPKTLLMVGGNFTLDVMITSNFESFYTDTLSLGMLINSQVTTNPSTFVFGGLQGYNGSETITYFDAAIIPEPDSIFMLSIALILLLVWSRRGTGKRPRIWFGVRGGNVIVTKPEY